MRFAGFFLALIGFFGGGIAAALSTSGAPTLAPAIFLTGIFVAGAVIMAIGDAVIKIKAVIASPSRND